MQSPVNIVSQKGDTVTFNIRGLGGHAARPHRTIDPVVIGSLVVLALQSVVARRWLKDLQLAEGDGSMWQLSSNRPTSAAAKSESLFYRKLLESMHDAVLFIDSSLKIMLWNRAAERLTIVK